jgi:hypothetical protein
MSLDVGRLERNLMVSLRKVRMRLGPLVSIEMRSALFERTDHT